MDSVSQRQEENRSELIELTTQIHKSSFLAWSIFCSNLNPSNGYPHQDVFTTSIAFCHRYCLFSPILMGELSYPTSFVAGKLLNVVTIDPVEDPNVLIFNAQELSENFINCFTRMESNTVVEFIGFKSSKYLRKKARTQKPTDKRHTCDTIAICNREDLNPATEFELKILNHKQKSAKKVFSSFRHHYEQWREEYDR